MANKVKIDIVSDVVCPWCTVGYKRLEQAINELGIQNQVEIEWQPFELNPHMSNEGQNLKEHMIEKYNLNTEKLNEIQQYMTDAANEVDFVFDFHDEMLMVNTFEAHVLLEYAKDFDKQTELKMHLMTAYFSNKEDVSKKAVLKKALLDVGLNAEEALARLDNEEALQEVQSKQDYWKNLGVSSVPTIVFNRKSAVTGAQPIDTLKKVLTDVVAQNN